MGEDSTPFVRVKDVRGSDGALGKNYSSRALETGGNGEVNCALFLATVDDRVSTAAIDDMSNQGIHLVVPEALKKSKETCYVGKTNVITFREFFDDEISSKRPGCRQN